MSEQETAIMPNPDRAVIDRGCWVRLNARGVVTAAASFRRNDLADELRARSFVEEAMAEGHSTRRLSTTSSVRLSEPLPEDAR